jgi:DNA-binding MarR family transcriptional regulator
MRRPSDEHSIYSKPGHLIRRLQQISVAIFMTETAGFDITPVQYSALLAVRNHPGIDQTALMRIIAFDRSTIGEVLGRLEAKRLVTRGVAKRDRRARVLFITPEGRRLLAKLTPRVNAAQKAIMSPLGPAERALFMQLMRRLVDLNNDQSRVPLRVDPGPSPGARKRDR